MNLPQGLTDFSEIVIDSFFIVDLERNIVDFNRAFRSMLPRNVARKLKGKKCYDVLQLDICKENCIAQQCWKAGTHVRLDEIRGKLAEDTHEFRFILSSIPIRDDKGEVIGAMELQRNVTDEALVQVKYQKQMEASAKQQKQLEETLQQRTGRLIEVSRRLYDAQRSLLLAKTDLLG